MYFITTLRILDTVVDDCRTVGYYVSYVKAYDCCKFNRCDIFEDGYYKKYRTADTEFDAMFILKASLKTSFRVKIDL